MNEAKLVIKRKINRELTEPLYEHHAKELYELLRVSLFCKSPAEVGVDSDFFLGRTVGSLCDSVQFGIFSPVDSKH